MFVVDVYAGLALVVLVVYPLLLKAHGLSVRSFAAGVWPATQLGSCRARPSARCR